MLLVRRVTLLQSRIFRCAALVIVQHQITIFSSLGGDEAGYGQ
jgi:hypothetical protein